MKMEELTAQWIAEADRIVELVHHEFILMNEKQLHYKVHVNYCSICQIILHVLSTNKNLFTCIEQAIPVAKSIVNSEQYKPGYFAKYYIKQMSIKKCKPQRKIVQNTDTLEQSSENLFSIIIVQQNRIKELVTLCKSLDMNSRVVSFHLFGLVKLSIAETFDFLILHQKSHFRMARHILILQQI